MMNQLMLVGRLAKEPELKESENGTKYLNMTIAVNRAFKNAEGVYETDFIDIKTFGGIAEATTEYCKKGDTIGVKGRLQTSSYEKDGQKKVSLDVIAEKVSFLSMAKEEQNKNNRGDR